LDAFILISPQRNWSIPAELKNAIDYLFHEWKDRPAMIVTYGGRGGHQCAGHLKTVLGSIGVHVVDKMVGMAFPSPEFRDKCFKGQELGLDANNDAGSWGEHKSEIVSAWDELVNVATPATWQTARHV
jgi:multimeric flavodoxin WrbA